MVERRLHQITRWLTIGICLVQAPSYLAGLELFGSSFCSFLLGKGPIFCFFTIILVTGCVFAMWLGEKITDKGIGNGISLLIMVGIIANFPSSFLKNCASTAGAGGYDDLIELVVWFVIILASVC